MRVRYRRTSMRVMSASRHLIQSAGSSGISLSIFAMSDEWPPATFAEKDHFGDIGGHRDHCTRRGRNDRGAAAGSNAAGRWIRGSRDSRRDGERRTLYRAIATRYDKLARKFLAAVRSTEDRP
jgi:hypothetical protein